MTESHQQLADTGDGALADGPRSSSAIGRAPPTMPAGQPATPSLEPRSYKFYTLILALVTVSVWSWVLGSEADEIELDDLAIFFAAMALILAIQAACIYLCDRLLKLFLPSVVIEYIANVGISLIFAVNLYFFVFRIVEAPLRVQVGSSALGAAALCAGFFVSRRFSVIATLLTVFVGIFFAISVGKYAYTRAALASIVKFDVRPIAVNSRRNVYLIGFESLHSPKAFRDLYGVKDLPHVDFLRKQDFRVFDRSYSADMRTRRTYSRILEFHRPLDEDDFNKRTVFAAPNSTTKSFQNSGYKVQFMYRTNHFNVKDGTFDYNLPPDAFYACSFLPRDYFYYLCSRKAVGFINRYLYGVPPLGMQKEVDQFKSRVDAVLASGNPWLTVVHIGYPFHSPGTQDYRDAEAVQSFRKRIGDSLPSVDKWVHQSISYVLEKDPGAVIVTFGDHGAELTRGLDLQVLPHDEERNRYFSTEQEIEDRYGAMLAVYPSDFCANRIYEGSSTSYLVESVIACLNGNDDPSAAEVLRNRTIFILGEPTDVRRYVPL